MNILIVYAHPSKKSYTFQLFNQLKSMFAEQNWEVEESDLYSMNFRSDMTEQEYEREGFSNTALPISADVVLEHQKIENADCIIFLYPVWWSDCPAKLKGWFDRVFSLGYAYGHKPNLQKMKIIKYGVVICTSGYSNEQLNSLGIGQSMQTILLEDRLGKRFEHKEMLILGGTLQLDEVKLMHTKRIEELKTKIMQYCS